MRLNQPKWLWGTPSYLDWNNPSTGKSPVVVQVNRVDLLSIWSWVLLWGLADSYLGRELAYLTLPCWLHICDRCIFFADNFLWHGVYTVDEKSASVNQLAQPSSGSIVAVQPSKTTTPPSLVSVDRDTTGQNFIFVLKRTGGPSRANVDEAHFQLRITISCRLGSGWWHQSWKIQKIVVAKKNESLLSPTTKRSTILDLATSSSLVEMTWVHSLQGGAAGLKPLGLPGPSFPSAKVRQHCCIRRRKGCFRKDADEKGTTTSLSLKWQGNGSRVPSIETWRWMMRRHGGASSPPRPSNESESRIVFWPLLPLERTRFSNIYASYKTESVEKCIKCRSLTVNLAFESGSFWSWLGKCLGRPVHVVVWARPNDGLTNQTPLPPFPTDDHPGVHTHTHIYYYDLYLSSYDHTIQPPTNIMTYYTNYQSKPGNNDVICGRGGLSNNHPGNGLFRRLVQANKQHYNEAVSAQHRQMLAYSIAAAVHNISGRFVQKDDSPASGGWIEIHLDEAAKKILQALWDAQHSHSSSAKKNLPDGRPSSSMLVVPSWKDNISFSSTVSTEQEKDSSSSRNRSSLRTSFQVAQALFDVADEVLSSSTTKNHFAIDTDEDEWEPIKLADIVPSRSPLMYVPTQTSSSPQNWSCNSGYYAEDEESPVRYAPPSAAEAPVLHRYSSTSLSLDDVMDLCLESYVTDDDDDDEEMLFTDELQMWMRCSRTSIMIK